METLLSIGIIQSILFLLLNLQKKNKQLQDWVMISWLLLFAIHLFLILNWDNIAETKFFLVLIKAFSLLHGPMLYIYSSLVFSPKIALRQLLHLLPFVLLILLSYLVSSEFEVSYEYLLAALKICSYIIYSLLSIQLVNKGLRDWEMKRSDELRSRVSWIKIIAYIFLVGIAIGVANIFLSFALKVEFSLWIDMLQYVASITLMGFYGLKLGVLYEPDRSLHASELGKNYRHSPLELSDRNKLAEKIESFFNTQQDYLDPDFSLQALSEALDTPKHHLSETINSDMGSTFYTLVNERRIQYAQKLIREGRIEHLTIEAIGYESGFNSKSAFFQHFKKYTGKTPKQYKSEMSAD